MTNFYNFIVKKAFISAIVLVLIIAFFIVQIPNFKLDASSDSLILEGNENLSYYQGIRKSFASDNYLLISYQVNDDLLSSDQIANIKKLREELRALPLIDSVTTVLDVPLFKSPPISIFEIQSKKVSIDNNNANLKQAIEELTSSPIYANNLVSLDGKTTAILINLKSNKELKDLNKKLNQINSLKTEKNLSKSKLDELKIIKENIALATTKKNKLQAQTIEDIRLIMDKYKGKANLFLGGLPLINHDIINYINNDLIVFSLAIILLMAVILAIIFKNIRFVIMPIGISLSSALTMTGILAFLGWKVTVVSANFFSLLLVMTLSITIHLIVRYRELANKNLDFSKNQLIVTSLEQMFKPCLYTALTTIIAFISLIVSDIKPIIDFGYMMSIGAMLALGISFLAFPIIMSLLPKKNIKNIKTEFSITKSLAKFTQKFGNYLLALVLLLLAIAVFGISKLSVENRFIDYFKKDTEINQGLTFIDKELGGTMPLEVIIDYVPAYDGSKIMPDQIYWDDEDFRNEIAKIHRYIDSLDESGKVLSIDTLMQFINQINNGGLGIFGNSVNRFIPDRFKATIIDPYISKKDGRIRIVTRIKETNKELKRNDLIKKITNYIQNETSFKNGDSFHVNGTLVLYNDMLQSLFNSQIKTIGSVFVIIFITFLFVFRSITLSFLAIITNTLPSIFILGIMGLLNIPLDLMTITIAAIAIGIGVDNAIHYIHRFKTEFKQDNNYLNAMYRSHASIGLAMFYTSITVTLGFLILVLSNFIPSIYFGIFTAIAMLTALLSNLTLLPKLILLVKPKIN